MSKERNQLDDCLERLLRGEDLESCLKDYPKEAEKLRPLLKAALEIGNYAGTVRLRPQSVTQTQAILDMAYQQKYYARKVPKALIFKPAGRLVAATLLAVTLLAVTTTGGFALSVKASENAMPGETLYPVKLVAEQARLTFTFSNDRRVSYLTQLAETRAEEIAYAAAMGNDTQVEAALLKLEGNLASVENVISPSGTPSEIVASDQDLQELQKIEIAVKDSSAKVKDKIKEVKEPDPEKKEKITDRVEQAYSKVVKAIETVKNSKMDK